MTNKITYGVRWSGDIKECKITLSEKSTVREVLIGVSKKMKLTEDQIKNLAIGGSLRPQDTYTLDQTAPIDDVLVIYASFSNT